MATYPMAALAAGEEFASVADILQADDLKQATIRVPAWNNRALRVRALSLAEQHAVRLEAGRAVDPQDRILGRAQDYPTYIVATIRRGLVAPAMSEEQAAALVHKHGPTCEAISETIWALSVVDEQTISAVMGSLAAEDGLAAPADEAAHADAASA